MVVSVRMAGYSADDETNGDWQWGGRCVLSMLLFIGNSGRGAAHSHSRWRGPPRASAAAAGGVDDRFGRGEVRKDASRNIRRMGGAATARVGLPLHCGAEE